LHFINFVMVLSFLSSAKIHFRFVYKEQIFIFLMNFRRPPFLLHANRVEDILAIFLLICHCILSPCVVFLGTFRVDFWLAAKSFLQFVYLSMQLLWGLPFCIYFFDFVLFFLHLIVLTFALVIREEFFPFFFFAHITLKNSFCAFFFILCVSHVTKISLELWAGVSL